MGSEAVKHSLADFPHCCLDGPHYCEVNAYLLDLKAELERRLRQIGEHKKTYSPAEPIWSRLDGEEEAISKMLGVGKSAGEAPSP